MKAKKRGKKENRAVYEKKEKINKERKDRRGERRKAKRNPILMSC